MSFCDSYCLGRKTEVNCNKYEADEHTKCIKSCLDCRSPNKKYCHCPSVFPPKTRSFRSGGFASAPEADKEWYVDFGRPGVNLKRSIMDNGKHEDFEHRSVPSRERQLTFDGNEDLERDSDSERDAASDNSEDLENPSNDDDSFFVTIVVVIILVAILLAIFCFMRYMKRKRERTAIEMARQAQRQSQNQSKGAQGPP